MNKSIAILILLFLPLLSMAQLEEDYTYSREFVWGVNWNSNGGFLGGVIFKWSLAQTDKVFQTIGFELMNVKHPKEFRYPSVQGSTFIFGKTNYLYAIRFQYGRERILFLKDKQQGVQINAGASLGPSIGIVAPYFVRVGENEFRKFDPDVYTNPFSDILGPGRLLQGLGQSNLAYGLNLKVSVSFEFGAFKNSVAGVETGGMLDAYNREIVLVPTQDNRSVFPSAFITLYWGRRK